jgi:16S rRNA (guanine966-N2)-methyltransferase
MSLRVLSGSLKGRILKSPKGSCTRPTLAIVRKALFDICQDHIVGADVLDLFAGSGAIGIEALSHGAKSVIFIENHPLAISAIQENIRSLKIESEARLVKLSVFLGLKTLIKQKKTFDLIYVDPPYTSEDKLLEKILLFFDTAPLLKEGGKLFLETQAPCLLTPSFNQLTTLQLASSRHFSQTVLHEFNHV